jgi:hypothetical protein
LNRIKGIRGWAGYWLKVGEALLSIVLNRIEGVVVLNRIEGIRGWTGICPSSCKWITQIKYNDLRALREIPIRHTGFHLFTDVATFPASKKY